MKFNVSIGRLEENEKEFFEIVNRGYECTGETLKIQYPDGSTETLVVFRAKIETCEVTPYTMCRDCGDHYIIARWNRYDRIEKISLKYTVDVEDR